MTSLVEHYKEMHKDENLYAGSSTQIHKDFIRQFLVEFKCESILDYGCGKGIQYHKEKIHETHFLNVMPSLYDPAVEQYSVLPEGTFDAVICTDVLEHIEEEDVADVIREIYSKADKFVYLGISNEPASAHLPDGRNAHVTQKSLDWWIEQTLPFANKFTLMYVYGNQRYGKAILDKHSVKMQRQR
jgi:2-polyprenyl-3-methyl-5-hydroxy-6-metoxy-1,4-benzoquinol methylase